MDIPYALVVASLWATAAALVAAVSRRLLAHCRDTRRLRRSLRHFRSPPAWPIIGNIHLVFGNGRDRVKKLLDMLLNYESPFVVWLAHVPMVVLTKGQHIQAVCAKCVDRDMMGIFRESVGDGITVARADKWRATRRLMKPAFEPRMLRRYARVFEQQARLLSTELAERADTGRQFDLWPYMANANVDIITENITGSRLNTQHTRQNEFSRALIKTLKLESLRLVLPWLLSPTLFFLYRLLTGNKDVFKTLRKLPQQVLQQKKLESKFGSTNTAGAETNTLLDILLEAHEAHSLIDERQIHDEMLNVIVTGSESTAVTGSFVLLLLAMHPNIQERVYKEVVAVYGAQMGSELDVDEPTVTGVGIEKLNELKLVEQCVKETLRIFALFPLTIRKTTEPILLNDNLSIPANCQVAMALHGVHLDPVLYAEPTVWNPDNFDADAVENRPKYSFLAFGSGPRSCIGAKYAILSLKVQIARIILDYRLETSIKYGDLRPVMDAIVRNKFGYPVELWSRKSAPIVKCEMSPTAKLYKDLKLVK